MIDLNRLASFLSPPVLYWSMTLLVLLEDDAAVLAFMFC